MKVESVIAPGIYRMDNGSFRVVSRVGDRKTGPRPKEKRFPKGTALRQMKQWQEDQRAELRRQDIRPVRGTLAADIPTYLDRIKGRLEYAGNRGYEIRAWVSSLGQLRRDMIDSLGNWPVRMLKCNSSIPTSCATPGQLRCVPEVWTSLMCRN
jgi:hypothetical protein